MKFRTADGRIYDPATQGHCPIFTSAQHPGLPFASATVCADHFKGDLRSIRCQRLDDYLLDQRREATWQKAS